jgi:hypothetical protein
MSFIIHRAEALRALNRRYKLVFVLAAAWAPILLKDSPLLAASVVLVATTLFLVSVSNRTTSSNSKSPSGTHHEEP